jgi:hypothetical protein
MDQGHLIDAIVDRVAGNRNMQGLFLAGSFGRSTADAFSDVDMVALVDTAHHAAFAERWRGMLDGIAPVVFWNQRQGAGILLNAITETWLRCDLSIMDPTTFTGWSQATVKPLVDRCAFFDQLPVQLAPRLPDRDRVRVVIQEFIRVLGLLPVVVGRQEYLTAVGGAVLLRDHLTNLMLEDVTLPDRGGALHLSRLLTPAQMAKLTSLPCPGPTREDVIRAHVAAAREFFPVARDMARRLDLQWPEAFEAAMRRHLQSQLHVSLD